MGTTEHLLYIQVEDTKCKTVFKNAFTTSMETQCQPTFETKCDPVISTAYEQQCKTITDKENQMINKSKIKFRKYNETQKNCQKKYEFEATFTFTGSFFSVKWFCVHSTLHNCRDHVSFWILIENWSITVILVHGFMGVTVRH